MELTVELKNVSKDYEQGEVAVHALRNANLKVRRGEFMSLFGPSGSGKTTLLNLIGGLDQPSSGEISISGKRIDTLSKAALAEMRLHHLGFIFQSYNLIPVLSAQENVEFVLQLRGIDSAARAQRARSILQEVGLDGMEHRRPAELSGGQQQRVAVARAIVGKPDIVLADEPTANLDSTTAKNLLELMKQMNAEHGITFVFSTHDKLVMDYARRLVELHDGEIISDVTKS